MSCVFSLITYNVHSCRGRDGVVSPERIAEVIIRYEPDTVCLQELDVRLMRSNIVDQAEKIAKIMEMDFHFHPSFQIEEGYFGNAILSRFPMRLVKAEELPTFPHRRRLEKRGALWVEIEINGCLLNIINTHLGLNHRERKTQIEVLLGPDWYENQERGSPMILCGDFNASPLSVVYREAQNKLKDVQRHIHGYRPRSTWPSLYPVLRIDHIFASNDISVKNVLVPCDELTRSASDHLPVVAQMEIP